MQSLKSVIPLLLVSACVLLLSIYLRPKSHITEKNEIPQQTIHISRNPASSLPTITPTPVKATPSPTQASKPTLTTPTPTSIAAPPRSPLTAAREAVSRDPQNTQLISDLGAYLIQDGQLQEALTLLNQGRQLVLQGKATVNENLYNNLAYAVRVTKAVQDVDGFIQGLAQEFEQVRLKAYLGGKPGSDMGADEKKLPHGLGAQMMLMANANGRDFNSYVVVINCFREPKELLQAAVNSALESMIEASDHPDLKQFKGTLVLVQDARTEKEKEKELAAAGIDHKSVITEAQHRQVTDAIWNELQESLSGRRAGGEAARVVLHPKVVHLDVNGGPSAARNAGWHASKTTRNANILFFLDGDDIFYSKHVPRVLMKFLASPEFCIVKGRIELIDLPEGVAETIKPEWIEAISNTVPSSLAIASTCLKLVDGWPHHLPLQFEDIVLISPLAENFPCMTFDKPATVGYRWRPGNSIDKQLVAWSMPFDQVPHLTSLEAKGKGPQGPDGKMVMAPELRIRNKSGTQFAAILKRLLVARANSLVRYIKNYSQFTAPDKRDLIQNFIDDRLIPGLIKDEFPPVMTLAPWLRPKDQPYYPVHKLYGVVPYAGAGNGSIHLLNKIAERSISSGVDVRQIAIANVPEQIVDATGYNNWQRWAEESQLKCKRPCAFVQDTERWDLVDMVIFQCGHPALTSADKKKWDKRTRTVYFCLEHIPGRFQWVDLSAFDLLATHRLDSDIPHVPILKDAKHWWLPENRQEGLAAFQERKKGVAAVISGTATMWPREEYLRELMEYLDIDSYGKVLYNQGEKRPFLSQEDKFTRIYQQYKFVLALENTKEEYYVTEKLYEPLSAGAIPIYIGAPNVDEMLPNTNAVVHAEKYKTPQQLALEIKKALEHEEEYIKYHEWRWDDSSLHKLKRLQSKSYLSSPERPPAEDESYLKVRPRTRLGAGLPMSIHRIGNVAGGKEEFEYDPCLLCDAEV